MFSLTIEADIESTNGAYMASIQHESFSCLCYYCFCQLDFSFSGDSFNYVLVSSKSRCFEGYLFVKSQPSSQVVLIWICSKVMLKLDLFAQIKALATKKIGGILTWKITTIRFKRNGTVHGWEKMILGNLNFDFWLSFCWDLTSRWWSVSSLLVRKNLIER